MSTPLRTKYIWIALVLLVLLVPAVWVFRVVHEPQLALRRQRQQAAMDPEVAGRLVSLAKADRFDLTDTLELIRMLMRDGRPEEALDVFERLHTRFRDVPGITFWYATSLRENRRWEEAERTYLEIAARMNELQRERPGIDFTRARDLDLILAYRRVGLPDSLMAVDPHLIYWHLGENALEAGMATSGARRAEWLERSAGYFEQALVLDPDATDARGAYANLLLQMDRADDGLREYQRLLEREPENEGWLISAAVAAAAGQDFDAAERYIRTALRLDDRSEWRLDRARYLSWGGRHELALQEISALISEYPQHVEFIRERHQLLLNAGRFSEFLEATDRWAARYPEDFELRLERARIMIGLERHAEAVRECAAVLALDPGQDEAALLQGEALLWMGQHAAAQELLRDLEERLPGPRVRKRLAQSYLWDQQPHRALPLFRLLDPARLSDLEVVQGYAEALAEQERVAADDLNAVLAIQSHIQRRHDETWFPMMLAALSRVLTRADHPQEAVGLLRSAVESRPGDLRLKLELADLLHALGDFEAADQLYRAILSPIRKEVSS